MGYGRSKLVTEHITRHAAGLLPARVLRIGQLSGDTKSAHWNETEAVALMIRSALTTGCLPNLRDETVTWLPVDVAADAIVQIVQHAATGNGDHSDPDLVYHLLNPVMFSFRDDLLPMLKAHPAMPQFDIVEPDEWLDRLEKSESDVEKNPSMKLLDFWRIKYGGASKAAAVAAKVRGDEEVTAGLTFETTRTRAHAKVLDEIRDPVSEGLAARYVDVWMRRWRGYNPV